MRAMGEWINNAEKYVFSRSLKEVTWKNSHLLGEFDPARVEALKNDAGSDIMIFGSGSIVALLTEHRLIDEYQFLVSPLFLGGGRHLLDGLTSRVSLELLEATKFSSGNLMLRYAPKS
jgi:dihydrofolate reductase